MGGAAASVFDLGVMTAGVELAHLRPSMATALGALAGAITNFLFARRVVFHGASAGVAWQQAVRYGLVSFASMLLNAGGMWLLAEKVGVPYFGTRLVVSFLVSVGWNFPLHRYFVFRVPPAAPLETSGAATTEPRATRPTATRPDW